MALEGWALARGWPAFARRLTIATGLKALTQVYPFLEVWAGMVATVVINHVIPERGFLQVYCTTLLDGCLLSIAVGILVGLVVVVERLYRAYQTRNSRG